MTRRAWLPALLAGLVVLGGCRDKIEITETLDADGAVVSRTITARGKAGIRAEVTLRAQDVNQACWRAVGTYAAAVEKMGTAAGEATHAMAMQELMRRCGDNTRDYLAAESRIRESKGATLRTVITAFPGYVGLAAQLGLFGNVYGDRTESTNLVSEVHVGGDLIASNSGTQRSGEGPLGQTRGMQIGGVGNMQALEGEIRAAFMSRDICFNTASGTCVTHPGRNSIFTKDSPGLDFRGFDAEGSNSALGTGAP